MRQARYLHALKKEMRCLKQSAKPEDVEDLGAVFEAWGEVPKPDQYEDEENDDPFSKFVPPHLKEKHSTTTRQQRQKLSRKPRTYGLQTPTSCQIGEGVWGVPPEDNYHFKKNATKYFTDKCHL
jgi:hypothetical protein